MRATRRRILLAAGALAAAPLVRAQTPAGRRTLGVLTPHPKPTPEQQSRSPYNARFVQLGWRVGENLFIERPENLGAEAALAGMAEELVAKRVDAILAIGPEATVAAARATKTIPIVFWGVAYPVEQGLIQSFARPGGNVTGVAFWTGPELATKLLEIFKELAPGVRRIAALRTPGAMAIVQGGTYGEALPRILAAAQDLGFDYQVHAIGKGEDLESVFAGILKSGAQGLVTYGTTTTYRNRPRITDFAIRNRLPNASSQPEFVEAGGLFSYGANTVQTILQSHDYLDKVLRGANPAEVPVERPATYELVVNLGAARGLGLAVPSSILLRADRVIE